MKYLPVGKKLILACLVATVMSGCGGKEERKAKYMERGNAYLEEGNFDKARIEFKNVLQIDPKTPEAHLAMGKVDEKRQEWRSAFSHYLAAVDLDPGLSDAHAALARFYLLMAGGDESGESLVKAREEVAKVLDKNPADPEGRMLHAAIMVRDGEADKASDDLKQLVAENPELEPAVLLLAQVQHQQGDYDAAIDTLTRGIQSAQDSVGLRMRLVAIYITQKDFPSAEKMLLELVRLRPDDVGLRNRLALFYAGTDDVDKAESVLRESLALDPSNVDRQLSLSRFLLEKRGKETAVSDLEKAIATYPDVPELRFGLASIYNRSEDSEKLIEVLNGIIAQFGLEPAGLQARNSLAQLAIKENRLDDAGKLIEAVIAENPKDNSALVNRGRLAMTKGDYVGAVTAFRSVLNDRPDDAEVYMLLSLAHVRKGEMGLARESLRKAVDLDSENLSYRLRMAQFLHQTGDNKESLKEVNRLLGKDSGNFDGLVLKAKILGDTNDADLEATLEKMIETSPDRPEGYLGLSQVYVSKGDFDGAVRLMDEFLEKYPANVLGLVGKAEILGLKGDGDAIKSVVEQLKAVAPNAAIGYAMMGRYYMAVKEPKLAEAEYLMALEKDPGHVEALKELVSLEVNQGRQEEAESRLRDVIVKQPEHRLAHQLLAMVLAQKGDYSGAAASLRSHIGLVPGDSSAFQQLAALKSKEGDIDGMKQAYIDGLEAVPNDIRLLVGLGSLNEMQKDYESAIELYERALKVDPDNAIAINNLSMLLVERRSDKKSLERALQVASRLNGAKPPAFRDTLAWVYYRNGKYDEAVKILESVVAEHPDVSTFDFHMGMAYYKSDRPDDARRFLAKVLEKDDEFPMRDEAQKTLDLLR